MLNGQWLNPDPVQIQQFRDQYPFPHLRMTGFIGQADFAELQQQFPAKALFEHHRGFRRWGKQRPHNRYYLALGKNRYQRRRKAADSGPGTVCREALPQPWRDLVTQLESPEYIRFLERMLGEKAGPLRFAWHLSYGDCEVSPHVDAPTKLATHIFYLNNEDDWRPEWGGETLVLGGCRRQVRNPEFEDFATLMPIAPLGNASFLFHNKPGAWHGVRPLTCPAGCWRRSFHAIVQRP